MPVADATLYVRDVAELHARDAATLYARDVGQGPPLVVLHGGPDFDHRYFLPALDRLADSYRLIYYDQRGRGKSADGVRPDADDPADGEERPHDRRQ